MISAGYAVHLEMERALNRRIRLVWLSAVLIAALAGIAGRHIF